MRIASTSFLVPALFYRTIPYHIVAFRPGLSWSCRQLFQNYPPHTHAERHLHKRHPAIEKFFFHGRGEADKEHVCFAITYHLGNLRFFLFYIIVVPISSHLQSGISFSEFLNHFFYHPLPCPKKEGPIPFFSS